MGKNLFDISEQEVKEAYRILGVKESIDDIKLLRKYLKLFNTYNEGLRVNKKTRDKAERVWEAYHTIETYQMKKKYESSYKLEDRTIVFSLPNREFFKDPIKAKFMTTTATDYSKICGGGESWYMPKPYDGCDGYIKTMFKDKITETKSSYYLKTHNWYKCDYVRGNEIEFGVHVKKRFPGIRPIIDLCRSDFSFDDSKDYYEIEYGEYPQTLAPANVALELEFAYRSNDLIATGKTYTKDSNNLETEEYDDKIKPIQNIEYYYEGKKYIRVVHNILNSLDQFRLSNGKMTSS